MSPTPRGIVQRETVKPDFVISRRRTSPTPDQSRRQGARESRAGCAQEPISRCLEWHLFEGENPVTSVKLTKEPRQRLRFLEAVEEARLLAACAEPLRTMVLVGIHCGLRLKSEALTLRWADVDFGRRQLTVQSSYAKNGKSRAVEMNSLVRAALERLSRRSELVFAKPNGTPYHAVRGFRAACRAAGLAKVVPHTLRHTFATRLIEAGVDLRTVQELGGWSNLAMLERY